LNIRLLVAISAIVFSSALLVQAQNGFTVWAKDGGCDRELHYNEIKDGKVGEAKLAVKKGPGADIWIAISYDGNLIAFGRAQSAFNGRYGKCDYHSYPKYDVFIARIDNGKILPAEPVKVDYGYWPSWAMDENAKDPSKPKTLYYTKYADQTIRKAVINPDGTIASKGELHATCLKKVTGASAHTQGSPDGKYIAYRPGGIKVQDIAAKKNIDGSGGGGCHPCWGPRSKYLMWSKNNVCRIENGETTMKGKKAGIGTYFQGISNDSYYDEGKLWIIARIGGSGQNGAGSVEFKEVDISNKDWKVGPGTKVGSGSSPDIHIYGPEGIPKPTSLFPFKHNNDFQFSARLSAGSTGMGLVIESMEPAYSAGLYDMMGRERAYVPMLDRSNNVIPLRGVDNGTYLIRLNTAQGDVQKKIHIIK
jgi:hypothetical protein